MKRTLYITVDAGTDDPAIMDVLLNKLIDGFQEEARAQSVLTDLFDGSSSYPKFSYKITDQEPRKRLPFLEKLYYDVVIDGMSTKDGAIPFKNYRAETEFLKGCWAEMKDLIEYEK